MFVVDGDRVRLRFYRRRSTGPSKMTRRDMLLRGLAWCRGCATWMPATAVRKGVCREHFNIETRAHYARSEAFREERKQHRDIRRRGVERVPHEAREVLAERFDHSCAYCDGPIETWDHVVAVSRGGKTEPGNIVPACGRCNSSKRDSDIDEWLDRAPVVKPITIDYLTFCGALA